MSFDFSDILDNHTKIAIAVSGGPDSMALCAMVAAWAAERDVQIYAYTVDHGLRPDSAWEAREVAEFLKPFGVQHHILRWEDGVQAQTRLQESARMARYDLIAQAMKRENISILLTAHHQDDQAETILFRLAKGSGLDGLAGMQPKHAYQGITIIRPLLDVTKAELLDYCAAHKIPYVNDPSNTQDRFARIRLRQSMEILAAEGLTPKRLAVTAKRLARARNALDDIAEKSLQNSILEINTKQIVLKSSSLLSAPEEITLRVLLRAMARLTSDQTYPARLERVEDLCADLMKPIPFRTRTLGGIIFERRDGDDKLILTQEG